MIASVQNQTGSHTLFGITNKFWSLYNEQRDMFRAAFEAWFLANNPSWEITPEEKRSGQYIFERANIQFEAYLAALASTEVQAWKKNSDRYKYAQENFLIQRVFSNGDVELVYDEDLDHYLANSKS